MRSGARTWALYGLLALLVVPVFPHFVSPNELARWLTDAALVETGTPEVSAFLPVLGPRFEDVSVKDGRAYSNKAPGLALVALPGYLAARPVSPPPSEGPSRTSLWAMRLVGATLPALLAAFAVALAAPLCGASRERGAFAAGALLLATPLFSYGLLLFSHALVAAALFGAWTLLFAGRGRERAREAAAGALLGLAVVSELPAAVPAAALLLAAALRRDAGRVARVVAGGLPFAILLGLWNLACFGSPFALSSGLERDPAFRELAARGLFGISWPSPVTLLRLLADPEKGLLLFSPLLLLVPSGFAAARRRLPPDAFLGLVLPPLLVLLTYAGYPNWHGGWTAGPRYLVPALPFLALALAFRDGGRSEAALLGASAAANVLAGCAFPFVPEGFPLPWASFSAPLLARGLGLPSAFHLAGLQGPLAAALPVLLALGAALALVPGRRLPALAGAAAWVLVPAAWFALRPLPPPVAIRRGYVEEVYFGREGAIEASLPAGVRPPARLLGRRDAERTLPPSPWRF